MPRNATPTIPDSGIAARVQGWTLKTYRNTTTEYAATGEMTERYWVYEKEFRDGWHYFFYASLVIIPPEGTDVEDFQYGFYSPNVFDEDDCVVAEWGPHEDAPRTGVSAGLGASASGPSGSLGLSGMGTGPNVEIESAGPSGSGGVGWEVDIDDRSSTAETGVQQAFSALIICQTQHRGVDLDNNYLVVDIDATLGWWNDTYEFASGVLEFSDGEYVGGDEEVSRADEPTVETLARSVRFVAGGLPVAWVPGVPYPLNLAMRGTKRELKDAVVRLRFEEEFRKIKPSHKLSADRSGYQVYPVSWTVDECEDYVTPTVEIKADGEVRRRPFPTMPVAQPLYAGIDRPPSKDTGLVAFELKGPVGRRFTLEIDHTGWNGYYRLLLDERGTAAPLDSPGRFRGTYKTVGPVLILNVTEQQERPALTLKTDPC